MRAIFLCVALLLSAAYQGSPFPSGPNLQPQTPSPRAKLVVVVANRLTLDDLADPSLTNIAKLMTLGSVGLISPNCSRPRTENSVLLTAATGTTCSAGSFLREFYEADEVVPTTGEKAAAAYSARTGYTASPGSIVFLGLGPALRVIGRGGSPIPFGLVGDSLHAAGVRASVIGNADSPDSGPDRAVAALVSDSHGIVDDGILRVTGMEWEPGRLADSVQAQLSANDIVIVDYGPSTQVDDAMISMSDAVYVARKAKMLRELDEFIGQLLASQSEGIVLVSFSPPQDGPWSRLTPIVALPDAKSGGLLVSSTTRTPGLIAATDFAATMLKYAGVTALPSGAGAPASSVPCRENGLPVLRDIDARVTANHALIWPVLCSFVAIGAIALTLAAVLLAFSRPISPKLSLWLRFGMLVPASSCLAMLLAVLAPPGVASYAVATGVIALVASCLATIAARKLLPNALGGPVLLIFGATALAVIIDAFTGSRLCKFALPSSYQLDGFRYYGIGNEYAAALVSMAALVTVFSAPRVRGILAAVLGVLIVVAMGAGSLGGNFGAVATATVTFGLIGLAHKRGGFRARDVAVLMVAGVFLIAVFAYADWRFSGTGETHAGKMVSSFSLAQVAGISARRSLMNLGIAATRQSERTFLGFIPFMVLWFWGLQRKVREMIGDKRIEAGLKAILIGAAFAFLIEDSGVVMAALTVSMTVVLLVYSLLEGKRAADRRP